jgi:SAM-dependent MidA family methyltransferase
MNGPPWGRPPTLGDPALVEEIRVRISRVSRITFAEFMEVALYHPKLGYYSARPGARDYQTSPEVDPAFGRLIGRCLAEWWQSLGAPARYHVVEVGGASGKLARGILDGVAVDDPAFARAIRYHLVDRQPVEPVSGVVVHRSLGELESGLVGCVLSNELFDALPVHRVTVREGALRELYVVWRGDEFALEVGPPSTPALLEQLDREGVRLAERQVAEVCLAALDLLAEMSRVLGRGHLLTIDYGHEAPDHYSPERRAGTLVGYYRHTATDDPLVGVGEQDLTAHVDFTALELAGAGLGLEMVELTTQREFLLARGLRALRDERLQAEPRFSRRLAIDQAIAELVSPGGLGDFRVLIQRRSDRVRAHAFST